MTKIAENCHRTLPGSSLPLAAPLFCHVFYHIMNLFIQKQTFLKIYTFFLKIRMTRFCNVAGLGYLNIVQGMNHDRYVLILQFNENI